MNLSASRMLTCLSTSKTRRPGTSTRKVSWLLVLAMRDWLFTQAAESALSTACLSTCYHHCPHTRTLQPGGPANQPPTSIQSSRACSSARPHSATMTVHAPVQHWHSASPKAVPARSSCTAAIYAPTRGHQLSMGAGAGP